MAAAIHVVPDDSFDDWVYAPTLGRSSDTTQQRSRRRPAQAIAREREPNSSFTFLTENERKSFRKEWRPDLLGR